MRKYFLIFCFLKFIHISYSQDASIKIDTNTILIGQQIKLTVECNDINTNSSFPFFFDTIIKGIEVLKSSLIDTISFENNLISLKQEYTITAWDSGAYYIPSMNITDNIKTEPLLINVLTVNIDQEKDIKDIKQPLDPEFEFYDLVPWLIGLLVVIIIFYLLKKFSKPKETINKKTEKIDITPAHIIALNNLSKTEKKELWQQNKLKEYYSEISEILRKYIEVRFSCLALEATTDEIINSLTNQLSDELNTDLRSVLQTADMAKFAKSKPSEKENIESMILAKKFVNQTKISKENE
mgnify:CR=1 FL=1|tara:strand:+ start:44 stop:931 length:888 start_codon:yes stop_codon:yes gene_type:complete